jgi:hypothetical protein
MTTTTTIETFKLDDKQVHKLALEARNTRLTKEEREGKAALPRLKYLQDFKKRVLTGGPLSFMEAKYMVREQLTFDKWKVTFYEVIQFPQTRFFETEYQAKKFFKQATVYGRGARGGKLVAQVMRLFPPAEHIYAERNLESEWFCENYKPDPMGARF